jgi:class 3 adenylate cyclase/predicted ATPase
VRCPSCKAEIPEGSKFCRECGAALRGRCPSCGNANPASAKFCLECGHKLPTSGVEAATGRSATDTATPQPAGSAERRQLTVMFADLVGSTAMSARLDPEDMREIVGAYHRSCAEQITKAGGFVAKYMGDGVLSYFGYPQAHENDVERAVLAGLALAEAVPKLMTAAGAPLQIRVGIATGLVVVGDLIGSGEAQERGVVGDTPNLAARLQALAEPNMVVIGEATRRLLGNLFELQDLGPKELKGIVGPVKAFAVMRAGSVASRFEAMHEGALTALVGREEERELLLRRWSRAKSGEGQVVLLSGEAGIGKSRLTAALLEEFTREPHERLRYFCSPQHTDSALHPVIAQIERAAAFERQDAPNAKLDKLESILGSSVGQDTDIQLLAELLSIPTDDRYGSLDWSPQQKKENTLGALIRQLALLSRQRPVLMIFEDVHWIDPSSRELLDMIVDAVARLPVLLLVTSRPEFALPWTGQAHVTTLTLTRLTPREGTALVERLAGRDSLPEGITAEILERSDGIPLFVEELTKTVLEADASEYGQAKAVSSAPRPALAVPATLNASLMARLDRLGAATKQVAQFAAAIGREFSYELLVIVAQNDQAEVASSLARLTDAGLVFCRGTLPRAVFIFKHALVRDAAYGTLLRGPRQALHARIAEALEERRPEIVDAQPELLAYHFTEAAVYDRALAYWQRAGERALHSAAYQEAIAHFENALTVAEKLTESPTLRVQRLRLCIAKGQALIHAMGYAAPETTAAFSQADDLAAGVEDVTERLPVYFGLFGGSWVRGEVAQARENAEALVKATADRPRSAEASVGQRMLGGASWLQGDFSSARSCHEKSLAIADSVRDNNIEFRFGQDPGAAALINLAISLWPLGEINQAGQYAEQAIARAVESKQVVTLAFAHGFRTLFEMMRRDIVRAREQARTLLTLANKHGMPQWFAIGTFADGWARWYAGDRDAGEKGMADGMALFGDQRIRFPVPVCAALFAATEAHAGRLDVAFASLNNTFAEVERSGAHYFTSELYRQRGELLMYEPGLSGQAEEAFKRAIEIARSQNARLLELRAASSLARLWRDQGKHGKARDLLAPVYGWFTEGFETLDLKEARMLLDELDA